MARVNCLKIMLWLSILQFRSLIDGKRLYPSDYVKYLGILIDPHLNWSHQTDALSTRLSRGVGMLAKIRHFVPKDTLRTIYYAIFSSLLTYGCQVWGQFNNKYIGRIERLQNKAIKIINFANNNDSVTPLYHQSNILKLSDHIKLLNFTFVHDCVNNNLPISLKGTFQLANSVHSHNTRGASRFKIKVPKTNTIVYGIKSITYQSIEFWNSLVTKFHKKNLHTQSKAVCKKIIKQYFIDGYTMG